MAEFRITLRQFRKSQHKTQYELGLLVGVPQSTISKWERGTQQPGVEHAAKLAQLMGTPVATLLGFGETEQVNWEEPPKPASGPAKAKQPAHHPAFGVWKGLVTLLPDYDYTQPADPEWGKVYDD